MYSNKAVKGVLLKKGKFIIVEKFKKNSSNLWDLPGGLIEDDENEIEALNRELSEELKINSNDMNWKKIGEWCFIRNYDNVLVGVTNYICHLEDSKLKIELSNEHISYKWIKPKELINFNIKDHSLLQNIFDYFNLNKEKRITNKM